MANAIKKWLPLLLCLTMIVLLLAASPAAFAQTVEMGNTIEICDNYGGGFDQCTKHYIDYNLDLYSWGYNGNGQVGNGTKEYQATPYKILSNVVSVKGAGMASAALTADGDLYVWGFYYGETPKKMLSNVRVFQVVGSTTIFAITGNGDLYTMGNNGWGECGTGEYSVPDYYTPQKILSGVKTLKNESWSAYATCDSGNYFWGVYEYGKTGQEFPNGVKTYIVEQGDGHKTEVILKPTKMEPPARYNNFGRIELDVQHGKDIFGYNTSPGINSGGTPRGITFTKNGNLSYQNKLVMTNIHSFTGDAERMYFFTKSGELYFGSIEKGYCYKMAEGISMPYQKLEVGTKQDSSAETKIYLQVLDSKPTGSFDNFKKINSYPAGKFADVAVTDWFAESVKESYELDLVKGTSDTSFNPSGNITVAEAVTLAARLHSIYCTGKADFIQGTPWYQVYMDYAVANHIISAYRFQQSDYNKPINRREFARIFASAFPKDENTLKKINDITDGSIPDVNSTQGFIDSESSLSQEFIYTLYRAGVLTGNDEHGTFAPYSNIKRSEVAAIVTRMAEPELRKHFALK